MLRVRALALWLPALACAPAHSHEYSVARATAEREYSHGRYGNAAEQWAVAGEAAETPGDRSEALYREAQAHKRARQLGSARATLGKLLTDYPRSSRAPRAAYDLALIEIEQGELERGEARLGSVITDYPDSALATRAFERLLETIGEREGPEAVQKFVNLVLGKVKDRELLEKLRYTEANLLQSQGQLDQALGAYLKLARDFPYPTGAYWDDALWHAAEIERERGAPESSLSLLGQMLREAEPAHLQGSYTRARYAEAQYRIAEIYRDDLNDPDRARVEFRRVYDQYPSSLLRDDALWQEALLAKHSETSQAACEPLALLLKHLPESRYAGCVPLLCPSQPKPRARACHRYIQRELE